MAWYRDVVGFTADQEYRRDGQLFAQVVRAGQVRLLLTQDTGERVIDRATFERPTQRSDGIVHVLVNGTFVVRDARSVTGVAPGRPVRGR